MTSRPFIVVVSGKHLRESRYRDLALKEAFEARGCRVAVVLPSLRMNSFGYSIEDAQTELFRQAGAQWVDTRWAYVKAIRRADAVVIGCWRQNRWPVRSALALGKFVAEHDSVGGFDHWSFGGQTLLVKGAFSHRIAAATYGLQYPELAIRVTGSILFERPNQGEPVPTRAEFCARYGLDPDRRIAVFFPKGIKVFEDKLKLWFPDRGHEYHAWYMDRRRRICETARQAGMNLILKLHPAAYASYRTQRDLEYRFWSEFPGAAVLEPEDTFTCYTHLDVGIGIASHSALDMGYWRKPFIYVDADIAPLPESVKINMAYGKCALPPGPSLGWDGPQPDDRPYLFPSWVGAACQIEEVAECLATGDYVDQDSAHFDRFIAEFWHRADGESVGRIADEVLSGLEQHDGRMRMGGWLALLREARHD